MRGDQNVLLMWERSQPQSSDREEKGFESGGRWPGCVNTGGGGAGYLGRRREVEWSPGMPGHRGTWEGRLLGDWDGALFFSRRNLPARF